MNHYQIIFELLSVALLCIGAAAVARADVITFTGGRSTTNNPPGAPNLTRCGLPPSVLLLPNTGIGTSNRGDFTTTESLCLNPATSSISNALFTFNFASGDTLFGTYSGTTALPPVMGMAPLSLTFLVTGGTGLFADATGSLAATGQTVFNPNGTTNTVLNFNGTINTVPEPMTLILLGTGLAGIAMKARKRRKSHRDEAG